MRLPTYIKQRRRLDKKIIFQRKVAGKDDFNQPIESWDDLFDTRGAIYPAPGAERYQASQNKAAAAVILEVRAEERSRGVLASDRFVCEGVTYNIVAPPEQLERGSNIRIIAAA